MWAVTLLGQSGDWSAIELTGVSSKAHLLVTLTACSGLVYQTNGLEETCNVQEVPWHHLAVILPRHGVCVCLSAPRLDPSFVPLSDGAQEGWKRSIRQRFHCLAQPPGIQLETGAGLPVDRRPLACVKTSHTLKAQISGQISGQISSLPAWWCCICEEQLWFCGRKKAV